MKSPKKERLDNIADKKRVAEYLTDQLYWFVCFICSYRSY